MELKDRLSKTRYTKGLRCPRALYLSVNHYDLASAPSSDAQARFDVGHRVGEIAQGRYPGGVLIDDDHFNQRAAVRHTREVMDRGETAIFEAAFTHDDVKVRVDALVALRGGGWELVEVKSTTKYDPAKHLPDAAVQLYVLLGSGVDVRKVSLMHLDREYVYPGGDYDPNALLKATDITAEAFDYIRRVPADIRYMMAMLAEGEVPEPPVGIDCAKPYECEFHEWCHRDDDEPDLSGEVEVVPAVLRRLDDLVFPLHFVDFETVNPALPLFVGTRPYQVSRVQWSVHTLHADGTLDHHEWLLADASDDPSDDFMSTLLEALGATGTFVHYSPYERTQLVDIAARNPRWRQPLVDRIPGFYGPLLKRLERDGESADAVRRPTGGGLLDFDLGARVVRHGCLHPVFGPDGTGWSIKNAIKVLAPNLPPYASLAVGDGGQAMVATAEMLDSGTDARRAAAIRQDLLAYCKQDTLAMVEVYRALTAFVAQP